MQVLRAGGVEFEAELPFATLHQLLRPVAERISEIPERQASVLSGALGLTSEPGGDRFLLGAGVLSLLAEAAEESPLLCLVDDAQWVDRASREALVFAARRLARESVALLIAERAGIDNPLAGLPELRVGALDTEDAALILEEHRSNAIVPAVRGKLVDAAAGNPLALLELAGALSEQQLAGEEPLPDPLPVAEGVEETFLRRTRRLPKDTQTALLVAAAEASGDLAAVERAVGLMNLEPDALASAEEAGLVRLGEGRVRFRHPLARSAVYGGAPFAERRRAHTALAEALTESGSADRRAWHLAATAASADDAIAAELSEAAERALARGAFAAASDALERSAILTEETELRARRLVRAADSAWSAGESARALSLLERAHPLPEDSQLRGQAAWIRGLAEVHRSSPAAAVRVCLEAAQELAASDVFHALRLAVLASMGASLGGEFDKVRELHEWASGLQGESSEERFMLDFLSGLAFICEGEPDAAAPPFGKAVETAAGFMDERLLHLAGTAAAYRG